MIQLNAGKNLNVDPLYSPQRFGQKDRNWYIPSTCMLACSMFDNIQQLRC